MNHAAMDNRAFRVGLHVVPVGLPAMGTPEGGAQRIELDAAVYLPSGAGNAATFLRGLAALLDSINDPSALAAASWADYFAAIDAESRLTRGEP